VKSELDRSIDQASAIQQSVLKRSVKKQDEEFYFNNIQVASLEVPSGHLKSGSREASPLEIIEFINTSQASQAHIVAHFSEQEKENIAL
jgi:hypothetical protein